MKHLTFEQYYKALEAAYGADSSQCLIAREVYRLFCAPSESEAGRVLASLRINPGRKIEETSNPDLAERRRQIREYMRTYRAKLKNKDRSE